MRVIKSEKFTLAEIMTTSELAQELDYNQAYVLRLAKEHLTEGKEYRSAVEETIFSAQKPLKN
ncbi:hypothetical protein [Enterococcus faecium]|uniref:hypothetical protein n=1 Tax=Enterococcus faecium TaxID=1352 RepID=UPI0020A25E67|nr:hypothetical protein [Enterococcus faecium]